MRMGKWNFSHLKKSPVFLVSESTNFWRNRESLNPHLQARGIVLFCNFLQIGKFPQPLKKYIISVYRHLLLSRIQPQPSPFSPSSLILPTRLSQSSEPNRTHYTLIVVSVHTSSFNKHLLMEERILTGLYIFFPNSYFYFKSLITEMGEAHKLLLNKLIISIVPYVEHTKNNYLLDENEKKYFINFKACT